MPHNLKKNFTQKVSSSPVSITFGTLFFSFGERVPSFCAHVRSDLLGNPNRNSTTPLSLCPQPSGTHHRSQKTAGFAHVQWEVSCEAAKSARLPALNMLAQESRKPESGRVRMALDPWRGKRPIIKRQQLQGF